MELISPESIKKQYIELLSKDSDNNKVLSRLVNDDIKNPIFYPKPLNYEDLPNYNNEQRSFGEISLDLNSIDQGLREIKNKISELVSEIDNAIDEAKSCIKREDERISDLNVICGQSDDYNMVIPIYASDFIKSEFENIKNKYFGAKLTSQNKIEYDIVDISGNGYPGNSYVYNDNRFESEEDANDNTDYINDENDLTKYQYSRLITTDRKEKLDNIINFDDKPIEMVITLSAQNRFNKIKWLSETKDLRVLKLETSDDGITFINRLKEEVSSSDLEKVYNDSTYIYGADILCFPYCYYLRITFSSSEVFNDTIGIVDEDDNVKIYKNTKREKIDINNIALYGSSYEDAVLESDNIIIGGAVDKISLFSSEYIPDHFTDKEYIKYYLIINGTEHEVVPVNSGRRGIKLIKFSKENLLEEDYITKIDESIKNVRIKILINRYSDNETPYIGNIKLCVGKESEPIYV